MERAITTSRILGLFPYFDDDAVGGVQASGRTAWQGLRGAKESGVRLILFAPDRGVFATGGAGRTVARSKPQAAWEALKMGGWPELVFVWHVHLLRLRALIRPRRAPTVVYLHGIESWRPFGGAQRRLLSRVDRFLANSEFTWRRFVEFNPRFCDWPHTIVPLGLGTACGDGPAPDPEPTALMISRLAIREDYKGHREIFSAWPMVLDRHPQARLWIVGDGDLRPRLESLAAATPGSDRIHFWGRVSEVQKAELISRARCLALPSRGEGFGLVYLEAMRQGRPCLVSDQDAGREVVNPPEAGLAADPADRVGLADAVCRLMAAGSEWSAWSTRARERHRERFTAFHFQRRLLQALGLDEHP